MRLVALFAFLAAGVAFAGEYAVFATGARMHIDRHEAAGTKIRLYNGGGYTEIDADQIRAFEAEPPAEPAPAARPGILPAVAPSALADAAADRYGLPRALVRSVMSAESGSQPAAVSPKGAIGLMQLMPSTARQLGADPRDPAQNVDAGARYLRDLLLKYDGRLWHALAAYNAGPEAVDSHKGIPSYPETIGYIERVTKKFEAAPESGGTK
jgi:soluble lytic murein transglycosylase-like protein